MARCTANKKNCSKCKYRYVKGDKSSECPQCGSERRCKSKAIADYNVCRMHGAKGGRPPGSKYIVAKKLTVAFNRIFGDPSLWETAEQQALLGTRLETLGLKIEAIEEQGGLDVNSLLKAVGKARKFVGKKDKEFEVYAALDEIATMLDPEYREQILWKQIYEVIEIMRKNADMHKRWALQADQMITVAEVIEVISYLQQMAFRFIPDPHERRDYLDTIKKILPSTKH